MSTSATQSKLQLSILDLLQIFIKGKLQVKTLHDSTTLVQLAEDLSYTRYWFAEHRNPKNQISTSPDLLSAHVAAQS